MLALRAILRYRCSTFCLHPARQNRSYIDAMAAVSANQSSLNNLSTVSPDDEDNVTNLSIVTELATRIAYIIIGSVGLLGNITVITVIVSCSTMLKQVGYLTMLISCRLYIKFWTFQFYLCTLMYNKCESTTIQDGRHSMHLKPGTSAIRKGSQTSIVRHMMSMLTSH